VVPAAAAAAAAKKDQPAADKKADPPVTAQAVNPLVASFLEQNPGAGMPYGVQVGYAPGGFFFRSAPNPGYKNWSDLSRIPFELRIRGQLDLDYYYYKVTDSKNHLTGVDTGANTAADFNQLEAKRARIFFDGNVFDPNLRFNVTFDGTTRGIIGNANGNGITGLGGAAGPAGGTSAVTVDHTLQLFNAWVAYDFHPCSGQTGCGPDCPEGTYKYSPTVTLLLGKAQPFFALEEIFGTRYEQFVEYSIADWFFDSDDNLQLMQAAVQVRALEDRLFLQGAVTNGNDSRTGNLQLDNMKGIQLGGWYDFGGTWNAERKAWDLFGLGFSDLAYHCDPVVRVGGAVDLVPMGRRSLYTAAELSRTRVSVGAPGGTQLIQLLTGDARGTQTAGSPVTTPFGVDAFDSYTYEWFAALKYRGFSLSSDMWFRDVNNFRGIRNAGSTVNNPILYSTPLGGAAVTSAALFPFHKGLFDFGQQIQAGYFLIPKKLEVVGRFAYISGNSGNINGNGTFSLVNVNGVPGGPVKVVNEAFTHLTDVEEYAVGFNYYFYGHDVKWQTDLSFYKGGNPAQGGQSPAGWIPGVDGWLVRSQIQLAF
jgi:hypothetical protein